MVHESGILVEHSGHLLLSVERAPISVISFDFTEISHYGGMHETKTLVDIAVLDLWNQVLVGLLQEVLLYDSDLVKVLQIFILLRVLDTIILSLTESLLVLLLIVDMDHKANSVWVNDGLAQLAVHMHSFHHHALSSLSILLDELS